MSHRFVFEPGIRETAIRLMGPSGAVPWRDLNQSVTLAITPPSANQIEVARPRKVPKL